jgi:hypothetical protein
MRKLAMAIVPASTAIRHWTGDRQELHPAQPSFRVITR